MRKNHTDLSRDTTVVALNLASTHEQKRQERGRDGYPRSNEAVKILPRSVWQSGRIFPSRRNNSPSRSICWSFSGLNAPRAFGKVVVTVVLVPRGRSRAPAWRSGPHSVSRSAWVRAFSISRKTSTGVASDSLETPSAGGTSAEPAQPALDAFWGGWPCAVKPEFAFQPISSRSYCIDAAVAQ